MLFKESIKSKFILKLFIYNKNNGKDKELNLEKD